MHQRELLEETLEFLRPSERKQKGLWIHEQYSDRVVVVSTLFLVAVVVYWFYFGVVSTMVFGFVIWIVALFSEGVLRFLYGYTGRDAVKYYSVKFYENPNMENLEQIESWNSNPFDLSTEYYYPQIGRLIREGKNRPDTVEYVRERLPDELRIIERRENDSFQSIAELDVEDLEIDEYYAELIREANYCYKFGAYTSVSVLVRKITEKLMSDILMNKGLYTELSTEYGFEEMVDVFISKIAKERLPEEKTAELEDSLDIWIRKKGNKGAHKDERFNKEEITQLMYHAQNAIRILLVLRNEDS